MKKLTGVVVFMFVLLLAACSAQSSGAVVSSSSKAESSGAPSILSGSASTSEGSLPHSTPEEKQVSGTIVDATMNTITIETMEGMQLSFGTADADKSDASGLLLGSRVTIYYVGEIEGEDTSNAVVTRIEQMVEVTTSGG